MFLDVIWKKDGKEHKTSVHISKLFPVIRDMEYQGVRTWFKVSPN